MLPDRQSRSARPARRAQQGGPERNQDHVLGTAPSSSNTSDVGYFEHPNFCSGTERLAGRSGLPHCRELSVEERLGACPWLEPSGCQSDRYSSRRRESTAEGAKLPIANIATLSCEGPRPFAGDRITGR